MKVSALIGLVLLVCSVAIVARAQSGPLTYPQLLTALNARLPAGMTHAKLLAKLITDVNSRKVDKQLTPDIEDILRQAGATDELIDAIRNNSPSSPYTDEAPVSRPKPATDPAETASARRLFTYLVNSAGEMVNTSEKPIQHEKHRISQFVKCDISLQATFYTSKSIETAAIESATASINIPIRNIDPANITVQYKEVYSAYGVDVRMLNEQRSIKISGVFNSKGKSERRQTTDYSFIFYIKDQENANKAAKALEQVVRECAKTP